jgi:GNAT superfamily N-acetyltransferase
MTEVRLATADEASLVHEITMEAFEDLRGLLHPPSGALSETLEDVIPVVASGEGVLAFVDEEPAGAARFTVKGDHIYIGRIGVLASKRRLGVAGAMLEFVEQKAKDLGFAETRLGTRELLADNVRLYQRLGYEIVIREPHHNGPDIVLEFSKRL